MPESSRGVSWPTLDLSDCDQSIISITWCRIDHAHGARLLFFCVADCRVTEWTHGGAHSKLRALLSHAEETDQQQGSTCESIECFEVFETTWGGRRGRGIAIPRQSRCGDRGNSRGLTMPLVATRACSMLTTSTSLAPPHSRRVSLVFTMLDADTIRRLATGSTWGQ
jgi:hypothetical protein